MLFSEPSLPPISIKLLCTFCKEEDLSRTIFLIDKYYHVLYDKIFVLEIEDCNELACTYNIDAVNFKPFRNTIHVKRNKRTNTIFTINALNELVLTLNINNGIKNEIVPWANYASRIILLKSGSLCIKRTAIKNVVHIR